MAALPVNIIIIISLITTLWYLLGVHRFLTRVEDNACEMTYMFEYPQFVDLPLSAEIQRQHPRYALYGYSEGALTDDLRRKKFTGVPVLFIPGNSGSHRQGRSLASVALRKALSSRTSFHFDFFLLDFNEDLSGVYGGVLHDQTLFLIACIDKVLSLYANSYSKPTSVVLVGHSAGGLLAKGIFSYPELNPRSVELVITLSSPHASPVVQPDPYLARYYDRVAKVWSPRTANVSHVTIASLGGGERDAIVRSDLIKLQSADLNVLTTGGPGVFCSTDHLAITWCKQLVLTLVRVLFDSVDAQTKQISLDTNHRRNVLEYHLIKRSAGKKYSAHTTRAKLETNGRWVENLQRQFSVIEKSGLKTTQYVMVRLWDDPKHEILALEAVNLNVKDWVYVCNAHSVVNDVRVCEDGTNLSELTEVLPAEKLRRKFVKIEMFPLKDRGFSHVVVRIPPSTSSAQVNVDVHRSSDRKVIRPVPRVMSLTWAPLLESTVDNAVAYAVELPGFDQIWQAFVLHVEAVTCKAPTSHAVVKFSVPWANDTQYFIFADRRELSVYLKLTTPRPFKEHKNMTARLDFVFDPSCKYTVSIRPDVIGVAGQISRYFSVLLPGYVVAVLVMTLRRQLEGVDSGAGVPLFHNALAQSARKYYVILQTVIIGSRVVGSRVVMGYLPDPDPQTLSEASMDFFLLPIILFAVATATTYVAGVLVYAGVVVSGQAAHKLTLRFLARTVTGFVSWSDWVVSALHQLPFAAAALLISLSCSTAGGLAISLAAAFYFLKICKLYEDYLEDLLKISLKFVAKTIGSVTGLRKSKPSSLQEGEGAGQEVAEGAQDKEDGISEEGKEGEVAKEEASAAVANEGEEAPTEPAWELSTLEEIHFHVTLCLLYVVTALLTIPSVLSWSRSFHQSTLLIDDPFWWPGIMLCAAGSILWQSRLPAPNLRLARAVPSFLMIIAVFSIMYGSVSMYRLPFLSSAAILFLCIHQISARWT